MDLLLDELPSGLSLSSSRHLIPSSNSLEPNHSFDNGEPPQRRSKRHAAPAPRSHRDSDEDAASSISSAEHSIPGDVEWQPAFTTLVTQEEVDTPASTTRRYNLEGNPKQRRRKVR